MKVADMANPNKEYLYSKKDGCSTIFSSALHELYLRLEYFGRTSKSSEEMTRRDQDFMKQLGNFYPALLQLNIGAHVNVTIEKAIKIRTKEDVHQIIVRIPVNDSVETNIKKSEELIKKHGLQILSKKVIGPEVVSGFDNASGYVEITIYEKKFRPADPFVRAFIALRNEVLDNQTGQNDAISF